jgi:hypothetical protein
MRLGRGSRFSLFLCVTPGLDPGAEAATVPIGRASLVLDARVNPRIKSGDAHDAERAPPDAGRE